MNQIPEYTERDARRAAAAFAPLRAWNKVEVRGMEKLHPGSPGMLVMNHTIIGVDIVPFVTEVFAKRKIILRGLGHEAAFRNLLQKTFFANVGAVSGTKENTRELMNRKQFVYVLPGGEVEAFKNKEDKYKILWGNRFGFVRLAIESGYPIFPVAAVGGEEAFDIVMDSEQVSRSPLGTILKNSWLVKQFLPGENMVFPIALGTFMTPMPKPVKFVYQIGDPIETASVKGRQEEEELVRSFRDKAQMEIERMIAELQSERME